MRKSTSAGDEFELGHVDPVCQSLSTNTAHFDFCHGFLLWLKSCYAVKLMTSTMARPRSFWNRLALETYLNPSLL